mgnify:CR=1 FL=1
MMPKKANEPTDWRQNILSNLPEDAVPIKGHTFPSALEVIKIAAFNRRMRVEDFVGRAALAVAVHDNAAELTWEMATEKEPPLADLRRRSLPKRRLRGRGFGPWKIEGMGE